MKDEVNQICLWLEEKSKKSEFPGLIQEIIREIKNKEYTKKSVTTCLDCQGWGFLKHFSKDFINDGVLCYVDCISCNGRGRK